MFLVVVFFVEFSDASGEAYRAVGYLMMDSPSPATDTQLPHVFIHHRTGWCVWEISKWYLSLYQILQVSAYERSWINIPYYAF